MKKKRKVTQNLYRLLEKHTERPGAGKRDAIKAEAITC